MNDKDKIKKILSELKIKAPTFAHNIGVPYSRIHDIEREKTKRISGDLAHSISSAYPQYPYSWLLSENSDMLKSDTKELAPTVTATQLEMNFSKIADAFQKTANAAEESAKTARILAENNSIVVADNSKVLNMLVDSISRLEEKIDKRGALPESRDML